MFDPIHLNVSCPLSYEHLHYLSLCLPVSLTMYVSLALSKTVSDQPARKQTAIRQHETKEELVYTAKHSDSRCGLYSYFIIIIIIIIIHSERTNSPDTDAHRKSLIQTKYTRLDSPRAEAHKRPDTIPALKDMRGSLQKALDTPIAPLTPRSKTKLLQAPLQKALDTPIAPLTPRSKTKLLQAPESSLAKDPSEA